VILILPSLQTQPTRQGRQSILPKHSQRPLLPRLIEIARKAQLTIFLHLHQRIRARLTNQLLLRRTLTSHLQESDNIALCHEGQDGVRASCIALPVWVVCDVARGDGDGIDEGEGLVGTWRWVAELWV